MGKHESKDVPPEKPFFKSRTKTGLVVVKSPSKVIHMRGQCTNQLKKSHDLLEIGAITKAQYDELQKNILGDLF